MVAADGQPDEWQRCRAEGSARMSLLSPHIVHTHPLPAKAARMTVNEGQNGALRGRLRKRSLKKCRFEAGISVNVAVPLDGQYQFRDKGCRSGPASAWTPECETDVFLTICPE